MEKKRFSTELSVRITDMNYGGHLGNDTVLSYFHQARVLYLDALGVNEGDIGDNTSLTQTEAHIEYKGEGFLGDVLVISVWIDNVRGVRFRVNYDIIRKEDDKRIAVGYTVLAGFNYKTRRPKRIPKSFEARVHDYQD